MSSKQGSSFFLDTLLTSTLRRVCQVKKVDIEVTIKCHYSICKDDLKKDAVTLYDLRRGEDIN